MGKATEVKNGDTAPKNNNEITLDNFREQAAPTSNEDMKERILKVNNQEVKLWYEDDINKNFGMGNKKLVGEKGEQLVTTSRYIFERKERLELEPGVSIDIPAVGGVVSERNEGNGDNSVVFFAPEGKIHLKPTNMGNVSEKEASLATLTIASIARTGGGAEDVEIRADLRDSVVFELGNNITMELMNGGYVKYANAETGRLTFLNTKLFMDGVLISDTEESDLGNKNIDVNAMTENAALTHEPADSAEKSKEAPSVIKEDNNKTVATAVSEPKDSVSAAIADAVNIETAERFDTKEIEVHGLNIMMKDATYSKTEGYSAESAEVTIKGILHTLKDFKCSDEDSFSAKSADAVIDGFLVNMTDFTYQKYQGVSYASSVVNTKLNFGKNKDDEKSYSGQAEDFVAFEFGKAEDIYGQNIPNNGEALQKKTVKSEKFAAYAASKKIDPLKNTRKSTKISKEIYTRDGFAKIENPTFDVKRENDKVALEGEGAVEFLTIPYELHVPTGAKEGEKETVRKGNAVGTESVDGVMFHIDPEGNLSGEFEDGEAVLNLNTTGKIKNDSESIINTITLNNLSIEDGYLKADSLRTDMGVSVAQSEKGGLKKLKLFECNITGTVARESKENKEGEDANVSIDADGIHANMSEGLTLGKLSVEDVFGFLSGSLDYPGGSIELSAKKGKEAELEPFIKFSKNVGVKIPIGVPGVSAEFKIEPSASIAGSVGVSAQRENRLDADWEPNEKIKLGGTIQVEGEAGIGASAGISAGVEPLASLDLSLGGSLTAGLSGEATAEVELQYNESKKKLEQASNLEFAGKIGGNLTGALNLSSNAKFLFWKMQLFNIELAKKELGKLEFNLKGEKDKEQKKLTKGWSITKGDFKAESFSRKFEKQFGKKTAQSAVREYTLDELKSQLDEQVEGAEKAWATLCELKKMKEENREDTVVVFNKRHKRPLDEQIAKITEDVKRETTACIVLIKEQEKAYGQELMTKKVELYQINNVMAKCEDNIYSFQKAEWGGYKLENYKEDLNKDKKLIEIDTRSSFADINLITDETYHYSLDEMLAYLRNEELARDDSITKELEELTTGYDNKNSKVEDDFKKIKDELEREYNEKLGKLKAEYAALCSGELKKQYDESQAKLEQEYQRGLQNIDDDDTLADKQRSKSKAKLQKQYDKDLAKQKNNYDSEVEKFEKAKAKLDKAHESSKSSAETYDYNRLLDNNYTAYYTAVEGLVKQQMNYRLTYNEEQPEHAAADFIISLLLGEVSKENLDKFGEEYNLEKEDSEKDFKDLSQEEKVKIYREKTQFLENSQENYYDILKKNVLFNESKTEKRELLDFPKRFHTLISEKTTVEDLLRNVLNNKELKATPAEKRNLLSGLFRYQVNDKGKTKDAADTIPYKHLTAKFKNVFGVDSFKDSVNGRKTIDISAKFEQLKRERAEITEKQKGYREDLGTIQQALQKLKNDKENYEKKLESLKQNSDVALADKNYDTQAASNVIDIYTEDYVKKIKPEVKELEAMRASLAASAKTMKTADIKASSNKLMSVVRSKIRKNNE